MKLNYDATRFVEGGRIVYNDGRPGHTDAQAIILVVSETGMIVQFEDRADTTAIRFNDDKWMDFIKAV